MPSGRALRGRAQDLATGTKLAPPGVAARGAWEQRAAPPYSRWGGHMAAPSLMSTRRFSATTRLRLQVLFARAWEALTDTYQSQAADFVRRLKGQLPMEEALDRF